MHVLIVDDVTENIQLAMSILKEDGYTFSYALSGSEALYQVRRQPGRVDLILLDIMMPGIDGYKVCKALKEDSATRDIPIVFLTAKSDVESITKGFALGAVDYILKPFHAEELQARVSTHLQLYQAKKLLQENNIALEQKQTIQHQRLLSELEDNQREMIWILAELMEATSDETGQHIRRVSELSALFAHHHPVLNDDDVEIIRHAAPMHDIGKMTVPREVLNKPGSYTAEEFEAMKQHTENAYQLLRYSKRRLVNAAAIIAHQHHEHWNGSGYPQGLSGPDIHIYGRIVALADVFDALTHTRHYRENKQAWKIERAAEYVRARKGTQFDPELIDIFAEHFDQFTAIVRSN